MYLDCKIRSFDLKNFFEILHAHGACFKYFGGKFPLLSELCFILQIFEWILIWDYCQSRCTMQIAFFWRNGVNLCHVVMVPYFDMKTIGNTEYMLNNLHKICTATLFQIREHLGNALWKLWKYVQAYDQQSVFLNKTNYRR